MTKAELIEHIISGLPYGDQCRAWDLDSENNAVRFTWRGTRFRVSESGHTEIVGDGVLEGGNESILASVLIKQRMFNQSESRGE